MIDRKQFDCWGRLPDVDDAAAYAEYMKRVREFGKAIWDVTGKGNDVDIVFEHPGEETFPVSAFVVKRGGMVVICAGTTGYNLTLDARFLWMRQKRLQGSHFANLKQASAANDMVVTPQGRPLHVGGVRVGRHSARARQDAEEPAQAGQHGGAGPGQAAGHAHAGRGDRDLSAFAAALGRRAAKIGSRVHGHASLPRHGIAHRRRPRRCAGGGRHAAARGAIEAVRAAVAPDGALDPARLEREQHAVHGLAWLATYVEALRQMPRLGGAAGGGWAGSASWSG